MARPLIYKTVDELQAAIDRYFDDCEGYPLRDDKGDPILDKGHPIIVGVHPPTVTGLAYALGFGGRQALLNYQSRTEFKDAITRAKMRCEMYAEERLFDRDGSRGAQFSLEHNFRWGQGADTAPAKGDGLVKSLKAIAGSIFDKGDDSGNLPKDDD